ncbi:uncharacterized protein LOC129804299 [Phlebotomus papatasi]|uniref:uncharacterized protein LOC129804299 n=1 Tax=Phlebotomus papatasi TaxID=29031 RepID=UPI0024838A04|nr:uncharacterized protein LOC129804299 [Phlebotomus papatasi]
MDGKSRKPDKKRSSILKKPCDPETSDCTETKTKLVRRISFSGKKSVKEFILDEDKNTVWGTSYEESAESIAMLNISGNVAGGIKEDLNFSVEMDIEPDPVITHYQGDLINPMNKENETPDNTIWQSINMGVKMPLASSTMLVDGEMDISMTDDGGGVICSEPCAKIPAKNNVDLNLQPKVVSINRDPFSWLRDPKIVGKDALQPPDVSGKVQAGGRDSSESDSTFCPSPLSISQAAQMNRESTCNIDISTFHSDDLQDYKNGVKKFGMKNAEIPGNMQKMRKSGVQNTFYFQAQQTQMDMTLVKENCEKNHKVKAMNLPVAEDQLNLTKLSPEQILEENSKQPIKPRQTQYFPTDDNQMDLTGMQSRKSSTNCVKTVVSHLETDQMDITDLEERNQDRSMNKKSMGNMDITLQDNCKRITEKERKTIHFSNECNQMNLTIGEDETISFRTPRQIVFIENAQNKSHRTNSANSENIPPPAEMQMTLQQQQDCRDICENARKTVYFPKEMDISGVAFGKKSISPNMEMTLQSEEECTDVCGRKTIHFNTENPTNCGAGKPEMEMTLCEKDPGRPKQQNRGTIHFPQGENQMNLTRGRKSEMEMTPCLADPGKTMQKRGTLFFQPGDDQINIVGFVEDITRNDKEMVICLDDPGNTVQNRKTVYFRPDENQMNLTEVGKPEMEMSFEDHEILDNHDNQMNITGATREIPRDGSSQKGICTSNTHFGDPGKTEQIRETVYFPQDENQMNLTELGKPEMEMSLVEDPAKPSQNRKTVFFPQDEDEMNITGATREISRDGIPQKGANTSTIRFGDPGMAGQTRKTVFFPQDENQMNLTEAGRLEMELSRAELAKTAQDRKTIHFSQDENEMNITGTSQEILRDGRLQKEKSACLRDPGIPGQIRKTVYFHQDEDQMNLTGAGKPEIEMSLIEDPAKPSQNRKTVYFSQDENEMNITGATREIPKDRRQERENSFCFGDPGIAGQIRKTVFFPEDENQMNLTKAGEPEMNLSLEDPTKAFQNRKTIHFSQDENEMNITGTSQEILRDGRLQKEKSACFRDPGISGQIRKTVFFPQDEDQMNLTGAGKPEIEMSLIEDPAKPSQNRKTVYFSQDENEMNITGATREIPKDRRQERENSFCFGDPGTALQIRKTVFFPQDENQMNLTEAGKPEIEMSLVEDPVKPSQNRKTIHFSQDENEMNITGAPREIPRDGRPQKEKSACFKDPGMAGQTRKTVFFPQDEDQMNITRAGKPEMELSLEDPTKPFQNRKTIHFSQDENEMNITGASSEVPKSGIPQKETNISTICFGDPGMTEQTRKAGKPDMEMTLVDPIKTSQNRETVYFPQDENEINITGGRIISKGNRLDHENPEKTAQRRGTVYFPQENNQMNITQISPKTMKENDENDAGETMEMDITMPENPIIGGTRRKTTLLNDQIQSEPVDLTLKAIPVPIVQKTLNEVVPKDRRGSIGSSAVVVKIPPFSRRESIEHQLVSSSNETVSQPNEESMMQNMSCDSMDISECLQSPPGKLANQKEEIEMEASRNASRMALQGPLEETTEGASLKLLSVDMSEDNTMKICEALYREQRLHQSKMSEQSSQLSKLLENDSMEMKMLMEESYIEADSINAMDNTYLRLGNVVKSISAAPEVQKPIIRRETFTIHENSQCPAKSPRKSRIPVLGASRYPTPEPPRRCSQFQDKLQDSIPDLGIIHRNSDLEMKNVTAKFADCSIVINSETLKTLSDGDDQDDFLPTLQSLHISNRDILPDEMQEEFLRENVPRRRKTLKPRRTLAKDPKLLKNMLGSDLYGKLIQSKGDLEKVMDERDRVFALYEECKPHLEFFLKYPSRCQLPFCPSFKELIANIGSTSFRSIWYIDKFFAQGHLIFKHRKITSFEIHMKFNPSQLNDMDCADHRGRINFRKITIVDCDWYTNANPDTKSKLWIYLHTKFRGKVLSDSYLLNMYSDSTYLRDFLHYIDDLCCEIYAARPPMRELLARR